jgi:hypothetical protein
MQYFSASFHAISTKTRPQGGALRAECFRRPDYRHLKDDGPLC